MTQIGRVEKYEEPRLEGEPRRLISEHTLTPEFCKEIAGEACVRLGAIDVAVYLNKGHRILCRDGTSFVLKSAN